MFHVEHPAQPSIGERRGPSGAPSPRPTEPARTATPTNPREAAPKNWVFHVEHTGPAVTGGRGPSGAPSPRATEPARTATPTNPRQAAPKNWVFHVEHPSQPAIGERRARPASPDQPPPAHTTTATSQPVDDSPPGSSRYDWGTGRHSTRTPQLGTTLTHDERGTRGGEAHRCRKGQSYPARHGTIGNSDPVRRQPSRPVGQ